MPEGYGRLPFPASQEAAGNPCAPPALHGLFARVMMSAFMQVFAPLMTVCTRTIGGDVG